MGAPVVVIACFTGDTQVVAGIDPEHPGCYLTRSISEIRPGDLVLSREASNPDCPLEMRAVTSVSVRVVHSLCVLCLQDEQGHQETLQTTDQHPFYVPGQGWTAASGLAVGQQVLMAEGGERVVVQAETRFAPAGMVVYHREAAAALLGG